MKKARKKLSKKRVWQINIRMNDLEKRRLERVAESLGLDNSDVVRMLVKQALDEIERGGRGGE